MIGRRGLKLAHSRHAFRSTVFLAGLSSVVSFAGRAIPRAITHLLRLVLLCTTTSHGESVDVAVGAVGLVGEGGEGEGEGEAER